jgi:hypothetical protein
MTTGLKRSLLALLLSLVATTAHATDELLHAIFQQLGQRQSYQVDYVEKKNLAIVDVPLTQSGSLSFVPPDTMVRKQATPTRQTFIIKGNRASIESSSGTKQVALDRVPALQALLLSIQAVLSGDMTRLKSYYTIAATGDIGSWQLQLTPQGRLASYIRSIRFDGHRDDVTRIRIDEVDGDWSDMTLTPARSP